MTSLRQAWAALAGRLNILEPAQFPPDQWRLIERMHAGFQDRAVHTQLPLPIARFHEAACKAIFGHAQHCDDVETVTVDDNWVREKFVKGVPDAMAQFARHYNDDVDAMMGVLVPSARYRKGHYAFGRFTVPAPHGLHTDHSAEDPEAGGEPICIARIETLGTHHVVGDDRDQDARTRRMLDALRYCTSIPEGGPEDILAELLDRKTLATIPLNQVVLMVAGNASANSQITQHIAARPPEGGLHSAFFQRQYRLA